MTYVYFLANCTNSVLYIGVTTDLPKRLYQHQNELIKNSFSAKYKTKKLVYLEGYIHKNEALAREVQLKKWSRAKKNALVNKENSHWADLKHKYVD